MRLIEQFGRVLAGLLETIHKRETPADEVRLELADIARHAGFDLDVARRVDPRMLLMWLAPSGEIDEARFWLIGELLFLDAAQTSEERGYDAARAAFDRAAAVFSQLPDDFRPRADLPCAGERVSEIRRLQSREP
jgi:hypothetical protein